MVTQQKQLQQRVGLRKIVKVDFPIVDARLIQAVKDRWHIGEVRRIIVLMAIRGGGMDEPAIGPGLARRRGKPAVAHRKLLGERRQHRHLVRREVMHHALRVIGLGRIERLLREIIFDKAVHRRHLARVRGSGAAE